MTLLRRWTAVSEPLLVTLLVTGLVTALSTWLPQSWVAVGVALVFLGVTWLLVLRRSDEEVLAHGLGLGGLIAGLSDQERSTRHMLRAGGGAVLVALVCAVITFVPFYFGFMKVWHPRHGFVIHLPMGELLSLVAGQVLVIALPEEVFYRGYVQSRLGAALGSHVRFLGARVGPEILITSVVFALGHLATIHKPARLAVFFPSLLFGFLRARTGGVGAGILFHAMCNVYSELLGRGFGVY